MSVKIIIQFNGKFLTLPINPEQITPSRTADNEEIDIIGLGKAVRKGEPGLTSFSIDSFFPGPNSYFYTGVRPKACIEFINEIWETENINNNVAKITIVGIPVPINMFFVIDNFEYDHSAGTEEDIAYRLQIKKYVPYGVKLIETQAINNTTVRVTSPNVEIPQITSNQKTYKVQQGDSLWYIAKACTGNGNDWPNLYELNKAVIGSNPNLIKPGQVLTLPTDWNEPKKVTKLKPVSNQISNKLQESNGYVTTQFINNGGAGGGRRRYGR